MAIGVLNTNDYFEVFLKSRFPQRKIENLVEYGKPFLETVKKSDELTGDVTYIPVQVDSPQGIGSTLDVANTSATSGSATVGGGSVYGVRFAVPRTRYYGLLTLDAETMLAMRNDEGAFFRARERNVTEIMEQLGQRLEQSLWSAGTGTIGTVSADPGTGTTFTLVSAADSINFHLGMRIQFYSDEAGTARAGGPYTVTKVNEDTGVITVSAALDAAILSSGSLDYVARVGDAASTAVMLKGVPAWIPATAETSGTFMGVDRTLAVQKLQGHRQSWLGSIEETLKKLDSKMRRVSPTKPKTCWLSYSNFNRLDLELSARGYRKEAEKGEFGRTELMMTTPGGGVIVKAAPYVPETGAWLLNMDSWKLCTLGPAPHLVQDDGNTALRLAASTSSNGGDAIEIRWRYFAQLVCTMPYSNGYAAIS